jgi:hypothetical protein
VLVVVIGGLVGFAAYTVRPRVLASLSRFADVAFQRHHRHIVDDAVHLGLEPSFLSA